MAVITMDRIVSFFVFFTAIIVSIVQAANDGDCSSKEYPTVRISKCPRAVFRPATQGWTRFEVGIDENQWKFNVCRANLTGTLLIGKGYSQNRVINGAWVNENCWVAVNGTEVLVTDQTKIQYLVYESTHPYPYNFLWVNIEKFSCFPLSTLSIKTGPLPNATRQYIGRFSFTTDDEIQVTMPGAINENNTQVITGTYGGAIRTETNYELPVCF